MSKMTKKDIYVTLMTEVLPKLESAKDKEIITEFVNNLRDDIAHRENKKTNKANGQKKVIENLIKNRNTSTGNKTFSIPITGSDNRQFIGTPSMVLAFSRVEEIKDIPEISDDEKKHNIQVFRRTLSSADENYNEALAPVDVSKLRLYIQGMKKADPNLDCVPYMFNTKLILNAELLLTCIEAMPNVKLYTSTPDSYYVYGLDSEMNQFVLLGLNSKKFLQSQKELIQKTQKEYGV